METRSFLVLLVEDNPEHAELVCAAMEDAGSKAVIQVVGDGLQAMAYLRREKPFEKAPRPDLILLDLNLPRKSGQEVLEEVKNDPDLRRIPIIILSTSDADMDVTKAYNAHANCFITKKGGLNKFTDLATSIEAFWSHLVTPAPY